nr:hypothetical protein [Stenotrophomonas maltophilia]
MQVRKGVRRIGALVIALVAANAMADTPKAIEVPSPEAEAEILNLLERQGCIATGWTGLAPAHDCNRCRVTP